MVVSDPIKGQPLLIDLVGVENESSAERALSYMKDVKKIIPDIVVSDFSPSLLAAVANVYGEEKIAIDPFHVMQELNRAIESDLIHYKKHYYNNERKEINKLLEEVVGLQNSFKENQSIPSYWKKKISKPSENHIKCFQCYQITIKILSLFKLKNSVDFMRKLSALLLVLRISLDISEVAFALSLIDMFPLNEASEKRVLKIKNALFQKLKTLYRDKRKPLDEEEKDFNKTRAIIFFQPEKLEDKRFPKRISQLDSFLSSHPLLLPYRELTLRVGSIYRLPLIEVLDSLVDDIETHPDWGEKLHTTIKTFKKFRPSVLRFRELFLKYPNLPKRARCNTEYINNPIRSFFSAGSYLKKRSRIMNELKLHYGCTVRNFVEVL